MSKFLCRYVFICRCALSTFFLRHNEIREKKKYREKLFFVIFFYPNWARFTFVKCTLLYSNVTWKWRELIANTQHMLPIHIGFAFIPKPLSLLRKGNFNWEFLWNHVLFGIVPLSSHCQLNRPFPTQPEWCSSQKESEIFIHNFN